MSVNSLPWYYAPELNPSDNTLILSGEEWHHCRHVLRMNTGEHLLFFDGNGLCAEGILTTTGKNEGQAELIRNLSAQYSNPRKYRVGVALAPTKQADRTEFAVEKLVEIGVDSLYFIRTDHSEKTHMRMDRVKKITISAAKQSRKSLLPDLHDLLSPDSAADHWSDAHPGSLRFACHLEDLARPLVNAYIPGKDVLLMIGPEGGFSQQEMDRFRLMGIGPVTLGPHRMRVETAAVVSCSIIHSLNELSPTS